MMINDHHHCRRYSQCAMELRDVDLLLLQVVQTAPRFIGRHPGDGL